jgi:DNA-directed RNA polymerase sigma subunit (sigma70/sigma32)
MKETCVLDIADNGGLTLEEIGELVGVTRERIRQIEELALKKAAKAKKSILRNFVDE